MTSRQVSGAEQHERSVSPRFQPASRPRRGQTILGVPPHGAVLVMQQFSQVTTASWRRVLGTGTPEERESTAATLQFSAGGLAPLYASLKTLHAETETAGIFKFYVHTSMAHVRSTVGKSFPSAAYIYVDHIEVKLAETKNFFNNKTNNVSRAESIVNKEALELVRMTNQSVHHPQRPAGSKAVDRHRGEFCVPLRQRVGG